MGSYVHCSIWRAVSRIGESIDDCIMDTAEVRARKSEKHEDDKEIVSSGAPITQIWSLMV